MAYGDILIVGTQTRKIYRYNGSSWDAGLAVPSAETVPSGLAVDPSNGDLLIVGSVTDKIYRYSGGSWNSGLSVPSAEGISRGLAIDTNGDLLVVGLSTGKIYRYSSGSWDSGLTRPSGSGSLQGLAVDPSNRDILVLAGNTRKVYRYNGANWDSGLAIPSAETQPEGVAIDTNGDILIVGRATDKIYRYHNSTWDAGTAVPSGENHPRGLTVDTFGEALAASFSGKKGSYTINVTTYLPPKALGATFDGVKGSYTVNVTIYPPQKSFDLSTTFAGVKGSLTPKLTKYVGSLVFQLNSSLPWTGALSIPGTFMRDGNTAYLRYIDYVNGWIMRLSSTATGDPLTTGPRFVQGFEQYRDAFLFLDPDGDYIFAPGPDYEENPNRSTSEPYTWKGSTDPSNWLQDRNTSKLTLSMSLNRNIPATSRFDGTAGSYQAGPELSLAVYVAASFSGVAGSVSSPAITKITPGTKAVECVFQGTEGSYGLNLLEALPSQKFVVVSLLGEEGSLTANLLIWDTSKDLAASFPGKAGSYEVSLIKDRGPVLLTHVIAEVGPDVFGTTQYLWDGPENLTFNQRVYLATKGAISLTEVPSEMGRGDTRLQVSMPLIGTAARKEALVNRGPIPIDLTWIISDDGGLSWRVTPRRFVGRVSAPRIENEVYTLEAETWLGDGDRTQKRSWSDEDQQREFPGDTGLQYARQLSLGEGIDIAWPHVRE